MNEEKKDRRLKGSVLFTVVSVMSLLIIFLMGTLVLAVSENNRAHKSYSSSQTQYTARAAVDSILASLGNPNAGNLVDAINRLENESDPAIPVTVDIGDSSMGRVTSAEIKLVDSEFPVYDEGTQKWTPCKKYSITATVELGKESTTVTSYVLADKPGNVGGGGGAGGGFTTSGGIDGAANHTSAVGGTYIGLGDGADKQYHGFDPTIGQFGLEAKKYLSGEEFTLGNGYLAEAPFVSDGSITSTTQNTFLISRPGDGVAIWGDLHFTQDAVKIKSVNMNNDDSDLTTPDPDAYTFNKIPYLYVDGRIYADANFTIGDGSFPLNIFCGSIETPDNSSNISADLYCYDADKTSKLGANGGGGHLYRWVSSAINQTSGLLNIGGNFYSKGNLQVKSNDMYFGDVTGATGKVTVGVEGDMTVDAKAHIYGDLVVGKNLAINNDLEVTGEIYARSATGNGVTAGTKTIKDGYHEDPNGREVFVKNYVIQHEWYPETKNNGSWFKQGLLTEPMVAAHVQEVTDPGSGQSYYDLGGFVLKDEKDPSVGYYDKYFVEDPTWPLPTDKERQVTLYIEDATGAEVSEAEAFDYADMSYNGKTIHPITEYTDVLGNTIFPGYAEKEVILGFETYGDNADTESTKILSTVQEIAEKQMSKENYETLIPGDDGKGNISGIASEVEATVYNDSNLPQDASGQYVIDKNCTLSGSFSGKKVYFRPNGGVKWIKLDNVTLANGTEFIISDRTANSGEVNFMVEGKFELASNSMFYTESYKRLFENPNIDIWASFETDLSTDAAKTVDNTIDYDLADIKEVHNCPEFWSDDPSVIGSVKAVKAPIPNVYVYSNPHFAVDPATGNLVDENPTISEMKAGNGCYITAYIKAPYMDFNLIDAKEIPNTVYYDNASIFHGYDVNNTRGVFGCVVCNSGSFVNDWVNIYIPENTADGGGAPVHSSSGLGDHTYEAVDYVAYN